ncbi:hypothetical protein FOZ62_003734 [Perkinsus olseni]|uniref:Uncharacterized protein n=1 Tax=Perkinsus olseni TaxID=32597 RepID=A0A7J6QIS6_PEROL|nr:hypothetical protein FOZ62_003734 [Perkinsus olseni]
MASSSPNYLLAGGEVSAIGKSTATELDALRKQLGLDVDPWYDYSHMLRQQVQLRKSQSTGSLGKSSAAIAKLKKSKKRRRRYMGVTELMNALLRRHELAREKRKKAAEATVHVNKPAPVTIHRKPKPLVKPQSSAVFLSLSREDRLRRELLSREVPEYTRYRPNHEVRWPSLKVTLWEGRAGDYHWMQIPDFNAREPSETRRGRVRVLEAARHRAIVKKIEKRAEAINSSKNLDKTKSKKVTLCGYDDWDDDEDDYLIATKEKKAVGGAPLSRAASDAYLLGGGLGSIRIPQFDKMLSRPNVASRALHESKFTPSDDADMTTSTRENRLAYLIDFEKLSRSSKISRSRSAVLLGEPVPFDADKLRPVPKSGVLFSDQLPRGGAVVRGGRSRLDAAVQSIGPDRSLSRLTTTYLSNLRRADIGQHLMDLQTSRSQRARQTDGSPDRPAEVIDAAGVEQPKEPAASGGLTFENQLSRFQAALGSRTAAHDPQMTRLQNASRVTSTEMMALDELDSPLTRPKLRIITLDLPTPAQSVVNSPQGKVSDGLDSPTAADERYLPSHLSRPLTDTSSLFKPWYSSYDHSHPWPSGYEIN